MVNNGTNGLHHPSAEMDGHLHRPNPKMKDRKEELTRLILQSLHDLGYGRAATLLQQESGITLESEQVSKFREALMRGEWATVEELFASMDVERKYLEAMRFLIRQQKYMELLEQRNLKKALMVLRNEITPVSSDPSKLHSLSSLMMCATPEELMRQANWDGSDGRSRLELLMALQKFISTACMIPERRLETLIEQAIQLQTMNCLYHNVHDGSVSLFGDHLCERTQFPCHVHKVLEDHSDEVWFITFSNSGDMLASASKDSTVIIWSIDSFRPLHTLKGHAEAISFLAWSPDDSVLLSASSDKSLKSWNPQTGANIHTFSRHTDAVTSCAWVADGQRFVSGSTDKTILLWNVNGELLFKWMGPRISDLSVTANGKLLFAVAEKRIRIYNLETKEEMGHIVECASITSLCTAYDSKHALVNLHGIQEVHLWNLEEQRLVKKYIGHKQDRFVIRSCLGGVNQNFVLSGSEDARVYVWHREKEILMEVLEGHTSCVNSISWNPHRNIWASASDDGTIRIWSPMVL